MPRAPDHHPCFGRKDDLQRLGELVASPGVTFATAAPRSGKTWLVRNLAFEHLQGGDPKWLVGYAESSASQNDLLREAIADLYTRWLEQSGTIQQAQSLLKRHKADLIGKGGTAVGRLLSKLGEATGGIGAPVSGLVNQVFADLARAHEDLSTGGITLQPITYDDARDLLRVLESIAGQPVLLVLDAWEQGQSLASDQGTIKKLLGNLGEWPQRFHLLVVIRDAPAHADEVRFAHRCCREHPDSNRFRVEKLRLDDLEEQDGLVLYLTEEIPAVRLASREWVIQQCESPAVIGWWKSRQPSTKKQLEDQAQESRSNDYSGLCELVERCANAEDDALLSTVIQLALLPEMTSVAVWRAYRSVLGGEAVDKSIVDLQGRRVLDASTRDYPSFGHATAKEAVRAFLVRDPPHASAHDFRPRVRRALTELVEALSASAGDLSPESAICGGGLVSLQRENTANLSELYQWPGRLAATLLGSPLSGEYRGALVEKSQELARELPGIVRLLSMALFNTLNKAREADDREQREALLDELRALAGNHPDEPALRESLAMALFNTLYHAKEDSDLARCDTLLEELRALARNHPDQPVLRKLLAEALVTTHIHAKEANDLERRDTLLKELHALARDHPNEPALRKALAMALFNTFNQAKDENDLERRDALLDELRALARNYPDEPSLRKGLVQALFNTLNHAKEENDLVRRDTLLDELRAVARDHADESAVREWLAKALFNARNHAEAANDLERRDALLEELTEFVRRFPDDPVCQEILQRL